MTSPVIAIYRDGGCNQLRVLTPVDHNRQRLIWQAELLGSEHKVLIAELLDTDHLVVADESGRLFFGDMRTQQLKPVQALPVRGLSGGCWLDRDQRQLWYAADMEREPDAFESPRLMGWSLPDWQLIADLPLPDYINTQSLTRRNDGRFLFYNRGRGGDPARRHGFYCCNPDSGDTEFHPLDSRPFPEVMYHHRVMTIHPGLELALMPCMDTLPLNAHRLGYGMQLVDLMEFTILWRQPVRYLSQPQCDCDAEEFATLIAHARGESVDADDLEQALESFTEALGDLRLSQDGRTLWLQWLDGAVQQLSLNTGQQFALGDSRLYRPKPQPDHFHDLNNPLTHLSYPAWSQALTPLDDGTLMTVNMDYQQLDIGNPITDPVSGTVSVPSRVCPQPELVMSDEQRLAHTQAGKLIIEVGYLALAEDRLQGAREWAHLVGQLPDSAKGTRLEPSFCDADGNQANELEFARAAIQAPGGAQCLAQAIELLCHSPQAARLRSGDSKPALADTVLALAEHSIDHLPLLAAYFNVIDGEHCAQFHMEHTLPVIDSLYNRGLFKRRHYRRFIRALPWPFNGKEY
ncbi:hypothetical protein [Ferrimonas sp. SCSIO 43195]|uniref:hypothetical protein n=1 Tax=Ferrimonas sp. SCSIO 43195 TaxID=2822844 RepID=UPI002075C58A|nr:hypothetical protein [Ferrimonas sp. SCSIO 43195]USD38338.1 hypothetical protein J8Z22_04100 [Ferrimonas sp. SCSIO 43195]